jgi:histidine ammonia-lyase
VVRLERAGELDLERYRRVVRDREPVEVAPALLDEVEARRQALLAHLESGVAAYGIRTGTGNLTRFSVSEDQQAALARSQVVSRAAGVGAPLPAEVVRGAMLVRLAGFLHGHAGASAALCRTIADRLNDGLVGYVPVRPFGSAGEISPLTHTFAPLAGEGFALEDGERVPAAQALAARGAEPYRHGTKEPNALLNGSPFAAALGAYLHDRAERLFDQASLNAAAAAALIGASTRPYSTRLGRLKGDPGQLGEQERLIGLLAGAPAFEEKLQAPVSYRVVPQVHGTARTVLDRLREQVERELAGATDSPAFLEADGDEPEGLYPSGGFHAQAVSLELDFLAIASVQVVNLLEKRLHRLLDARFSSLPEQLTPDPGPNAGLIPLHKAVVALVADCRILAAPASIHALDTSAGQEDFQALEFLAAEKLGRVLDDLELALAYELVALRQARELRGGPTGAARIDAALDALAEVVAPVPVDRSLAPDVERTLELVRTSALLR